MLIRAFFFLSIWSNLLAFEVPPGVDSFRWQNIASILLEDNRIYYLGGNSIEGPEFKDITDKADLKKVSDFFEFTYEGEKAVILPGDTRYEVIQFESKDLGKLNENIYGDPELRTESYPPGKSNLTRIDTKTFLTKKIKGKFFKYDSSWLLRKYFLACNCHPQLFANEIPPWIQGDHQVTQQEEISIQFQEPTSGITILNGFVDVYFPEYFRQYSRLKEVQVVHPDFKVTVVFKDNVRFTDISFPKKVTEIRILVNSIYKGNKFKNLAISAIFGFEPPKGRPGTNKELIEKYGKRKSAR